MVIKILPSHISGFHLDPLFYVKPFDTSRIAMDDIHYNPETDSFSANEYPNAPRSSILRILEAMSVLYYLCKYPLFKHLINIRTVAKDLDKVIMESVDVNQVVMACGIVGLLMLESPSKDGMDKFVYLVRKDDFEALE